MMDAQTRDASGHPITTGDPTQIVSNGEESVARQPTTVPRQKPATQRERVLGMLLESANRGVCGSTFVAAHMPRFSVFIHQLRTEGHEISLTRCQTEAHGHVNAAWLYRLDPPRESVPNRLPLDVDGPSDG